MTDAGLTPLGTFGHLEALFMQGYGRITLQGIAKLRPLRALDIVACTPSIGSDIPMLRPLSNLKTLRLHNERLTDDSLREIALLASVENLSIPHNGSVTDAGVAHLAALPKLRRLRVDGCAGITDASLQVLARLRTLVHIEAEKCSLTNTAIAAFRSARPDCTLDTLHRGASKV